MNTSIFDKKGWIKFLPKELTIVTLNGQFTLKLADDPSSFISVIGPDQVPTDISIMLIQKKKVGQILKMKKL